MKIEGKTFDEERALYHLTDATVADCVFAGPADGESALKEARNVTIDHCRFSLRYPLWHTQGFTVSNSSMDEGTRAAIWYAQDGQISNDEITGIKCLRECSNVTVSGSTVVSSEFGWKCRDIQISNCDITSEYIFLDSSNLKIDSLRMKGKYSFQYVENMTITNSNLDTKDAFWHSKNVTVRNSVVKGEYLAWYSEGLTLENCHIIGTQPFCYCKNLRLVNCTMEGTDLSFEYSDVDAQINGHIDSVKNPASGKIIADSIGEIIMEDAVIETNCIISENK